MSRYPEFAFVAALVDGTWGPMCPTPELAVAAAAGRAVEGVIECYRMSVADRMLRYWDPEQGIDSASYHDAEDMDIAPDDLPERLQALLLESYSPGVGFEEATLPTAAYHELMDGIEGVINAWAAKHGLESTRYSVGDLEELEHAPSTLN